MSVISFRLTFSNSLQLIICYNYISNHLCLNYYLVVENLIWELQSHANLGKTLIQYWTSLGKISSWNWKYRKIKNWGLVPIMYYSSIQDTIFFFLLSELNIGLALTSTLYFEIKFVTNIGITETKCIRM